MTARKSTPAAGEQTPPAGLPLEVGQAGPLTLDLDKEASPPLGEDDDLELDAEEVEVAPGRTVVDATGASVGPGEWALVMCDDIARLTALGFLVDPDAKPVRRQQPVAERGRI